MQFNLTLGSYQIRKGIDIEEILNDKFHFNPPIQLICFCGEHMEILTKNDFPREDYQCKCGKYFVQYNI